LPLPGIVDSCAQSATKVHVRIEEIENESFLVWESEVPKEFLKTEYSLVPKSKKGFVDELWQYSVSELFIASQSEPQKYIELECNPYGHWVALRFSNVRVRAVGEENLSAQFWKNVEYFNCDVENKIRFGLKIPYQLLKEKLQLGNNYVKFTSALSLKPNSYYLFPAELTSEKQLQIESGLQQPPKPNFHIPHLGLSVTLPV
jgi:hypothetical protein